MSVLPVVQYQLPPAAVLGSTATYEYMNNAVGYVKDFLISTGNFTLYSDNDPDPSVLRAVLLDTAGSSHRFRVAGTTLASPYDSIAYSLRSVDGTVSIDLLGSYEHGIPYMAGAYLRHYYGAGWYVITLSNDGYSTVLVANFTLSDEKVYSMIDDTTQYFYASDIDGIHNLMPSAGLGLFEGSTYGLIQCKLKHPVDGVLWADFPVLVGAMANATLSPARIYSTSVGYFLSISTSHVVAFEY